MMILSPDELAALRVALAPATIDRLCRAIDQAVADDLATQHALLELADALTGDDARTAHYLIRSYGLVVGCTIGETGKGDADRHATFERVAAGQVCPNCTWLVQAGKFRPLDWPSP